MLQSRRHFLTGASALALAAALRPSRAIGQTPLPTSEFTIIRGDVGMFVAQGGTIGWMVSADGVVVVDAQMPPTSQPCLDGLAARSGNRRIDCLFNTHHHLDHTGGNAVFRSTAKHIIAHRRVPELQKTAARPGTDQVYADTVFEERWAISLGAETITAIACGPAHTAGDSIVHFAQANVIHMGDLVFNRRLPVLDRPGGCRIARWIDVLERTAGDFPPDTRYIFGHAKPGFPVRGTREDLLVQRDFLAAVLDHVRREIQAQRSREAIIAAAVALKGFADHGPLNERVLAPAYDELTEKA